MFFLVWKNPFAMTYKCRNADFYKQLKVAIQMENYYHYNITVFYQNINFVQNSHKGDGNWVMLLQGEFRLFLP